MLTGSAVLSTGNTYGVCPPLRALLSSKRGLTSLFRYTELLQVLSGVLSSAPGGGVALLYASKGLTAIQEKAENFDQKIGVQLLQTALRTPAKTIADNAGVEGAVIVGKLLESDDFNWGYNAATGECFETQL